MISRLFDNDETFVSRFINHWTEYRSIQAGRSDELINGMIYFHNCLFPDFQMSSCTNCGSRLKKAEDRLDLAYSILINEFKQNEADDTEPQPDDLSEGDLTPEVLQPPKKRSTKK